MIKPSRVASWLRHCCAALACAAVLAMAPVHAQQPAAAAASNNPAVATDGATLIHGNYCGAGNRPGRPPIDALDLACMNHDACSPTGGMPTCDCNARLRDEAAAVAKDPRQAPELRSLASLTSAAAGMMLCKPMIDAAAPPTPAVTAPVAAAPVIAAPAAVAPVAPAPAAQVPVAATVEPAPVRQAPVAAAPMQIVPAAVAPAPAAPEPAAPVPAATDAKAPSLP